MGHMYALTEPKFLCPFYTESKYSKPSEPNNAAYYVWIWFIPLRVAGQEIPHPLLRRKVDYRAHKSTPLILSWARSSQCTPSDRIS
jgi:hypothetical protein